MHISELEAYMFEFLDQVPESRAAYTDYSFLLYPQASEPKFKHTAIALTRGSRNGLGVEHL